MDLETVPDDEPSAEAPEVLSLFGDDDFYGEPAITDPEDAEPEISPSKAIEPEELIEPESADTNDSELVDVADSEAVSMQDQYWDFAASVTDDSLFGDDTPPNEASPELDFDEEEDSEAIPATSFLFGDPVKAPEPEETATSELQNLIAFPVAETTDAIEKAPESTTVKTIKLLSDLLENGDLNVQEEYTGDDYAADILEEGEAFAEDLNLEMEEDEADVLRVTALDPEKMDQLANDLTSFEKSVTPDAAAVDAGESEAIDVESTESGPADDLWGG
jgi:hypothetical protein